MRRAVYEVVGLGLVLGGLYFFVESVRFFTARDYVAGVLEIFVGLAVTRAGLELVKLGLLLVPGPTASTARGLVADALPPVVGPATPPPLTNRARDAAELP